MPISLKRPQNNKVQNVCKIPLSYSLRWHYDRLYAAVHATSQPVCCSCCSQAASSLILLHQICSYQRSWLNSTGVTPSWVIYDQHLSLPWKLQMVQDWHIVTMEVNKNRTRSIGQRVRHCLWPRVSLTTTDHLVLVNFGTLFQYFMQMKLGTWNLDRPYQQCHEANW